MHTIGTMEGGTRFKRGAKALFALGASLGLLLGNTPGAKAFDTAPHCDLTRDAMMAEGFDEAAIKYTQVENWLVDYYSSTPAPNSVDADAVAKLHFDNTPTMNMSTTANVGHYWHWLVRDTFDAVTFAAQQNDVPRFLTFLGISLHAVQDFYSHSNWVETHPRSPGASLRTETWFNSPNLTKGLAIRTGHYPNWGGGNLYDHGDATYGMNHDAPGDSPSRQHYAEAYVFAYFATREWLHAVKLWVDNYNPTFWGKARAYTLSASGQAYLNDDTLAMYRLQEWVPGGGGHWKGPGSASLRAFIPTSLAWLGYSSPMSSQFTSSHLYKWITDSIRSDIDPGWWPAIPMVDPRWWFSVPVFVKTYQATDLSGIDWGLLDQADFYPQITIQGQTFTEATHQGQDNVNASNWYAIKFVGGLLNNFAAIHFELWDEDGSANGGDDFCDVNALPGKRALDMSLYLPNNTLSGDVNGYHGDWDSRATTQGSPGEVNRCLTSFAAGRWTLGAPVNAAPSTMTLSVNPAEVNLNTTEVTVAGKTHIVPISKKIAVTIHAVDAVTKQTINGSVSRAGVYQGTTDNAFMYTFSTSSTGATQTIWFDVTIPGYTTKSIPVTVYTNLP